jgi:serpin B
MKRILFGLLALLVSLMGCTPTEKASSADQAAVIKGNNEFALNLYARLAEQDGNLFFSPLGISTALAMTSAGARGETLEQMTATLHFPDQDHLHPANAALLAQVHAEAAKQVYELRTANALWIQKGFPFRKDFLSLNHANYRAGLKEVDYRRATEQARRTINDWVEKETNDKIKELLKPGVLDATTCLVLTNAIYFKGSWATQFDPKLTFPQPFHLGTGKDVKAPLMHQEGNFGYLDGGDFQAVELPYTGKDLTMVVLLPKKVDGLAAFEKTLTQARLTKWLGKLRSEKIGVFLPKFKMTAEFSLKEVLSEMGMPLAFDQNKADLSGMADIRGPLYLSAVVHKAFVDVNEEGTEAAAATAAVVVARAVGGPRPPIFRADHPFVFLIRDARSGSILFLGRVTNPVG